MLQLLRNCKGYLELTERALKELRLKRDLRLRNATTEQQEEAAQKAVQLVSEFLGSGQSSQHGIVYNHTNVRRTTDTFVSRQQTAQALRDCDPDGVLARTRKQHRKRGCYIVPEPMQV